MVNQDVLSVGQIVTMKETNMIQSGNLLGRESVDHEGDQHDPEREPCREGSVGHGGDQHDPEWEPCRGEGVWTMKDTNIIQIENLVIQSGSLVGGKC